MLKMVKDAAEPTIKDDPKPLDRATWQRIRTVVEKEACHRDWGCALYTLHRTGRIDNDQREAGDRYASLVREHRKLWFDPMSAIEIYQANERAYIPDRHEGNRQASRDATLALGWVSGAPVDESEFTTKRAQRLSKRYREASAVAGTARNVLEALLIEDIWPVGERGHEAICHALTRLAHFFATGNKRRT